MFSTVHRLAAWPRALWAVLAGLVAGTACQLQQAALWPVGVYIGFVLLALVLYALAAPKKIARFRYAVLVLLAGLALGWGATGLRALAFARHGLDPALEGRDLLVRGVVVDMPQQSETGLRFRLAPESAQLQGQPVEVPPRIDVGWYTNGYALAGEQTGLQRVPADVRAGERWELTLRLKAAHGSMNPHGFDFELWLWEQGVQATGYVRAGANDPVPQRLAQTGAAPVAWLRQTVRDRIFAQVPDRRAAGLIAALVVGDQNAIERTDWDVFRATGVSHLVSISGLHITMFAWGAAWLVGWLWRRAPRLCLALPAPSAALLGGIVLATAYAVFAGWGVPAQRTCLMLATVALLRLSGARWPWPLVWLLACAAVVVLDPWALLQPGFWLSFVAVGVLFATDSGAAKPDSARAGGLFLSKVAGQLREQWVITLALAPLTLLLFGQVSVVGLLANALAIPWVTLVLTPLAMLGTLLPMLWDLATVAIAGMLQALEWLAGFSWASVSAPAPPLWLGVCAALGSVGLVLPWPWHVRALGLPLLLPVLLWQPAAPAPGEFSLLGVDVGQGNAVLVRTAQHALLFDTGPRYSLESDAGHRVLLPLLRALGTRLDTVVLSHRDTDHVGGAAAVLATQPQAQLLSSIEATHPLQSLRAAQRCEAGQHWEWDGVQFDVLHPQATDYSQTLPPNAMSCVLRIGNGQHSALLVGDIEAAQEARLVAAWQGTPQLHADVLLVPHHGSKTSSTTDFLGAVSPTFGWVQAGYRNRFGHPAPPVVERYAQRGIILVRSPQCGAMMWSSAEPQNVACSREDERRYWHHHVP